MTTLPRRDFLGMSALATCALAMKAGAAPTEAKIPAWREGHLQIHFPFTGVCESQLIILPDGTTALIDCGDIPAIMRGEWSVPVPRPREMAGETIANYVLAVNPRGREVDYMISSHWHSDHVGTPNWQSCGTIVMKSTEYYRSGFGIAAEKLRFAKAIDRGFDEPFDFVEGHDLEGVHMKKLYAYLEKRDGLVREKIRLGARDQIVPLHGGAKDFEAFNICGNGKISKPDGSIIDLLKGRVKPGGKFNENAFSIGHVFTYGKFRYFTAGDFSHGCRYDAKTLACLRGGIEDALAKVCDRVDVAKTNHHAHHAMPPALVKALAPRVWVTSMWDQCHLTPDSYASMTDRSLYPGDRLVLAGVIPNDIAKLPSDKRADMPKDACSGTDLVIDVAPGGETYSVYAAVADDPTRRVVAQFNFKK